MVDIFIFVFLYETFVSSFKSLWSLFLTVNKSGLIKVLVWRRTADKPLREPLMTLLTDTYVCRTASVDQMFNTDHNRAFSVL